MHNKYNILTTQSVMKIDKTFFKEPEYFNLVIYHTKIARINDNSIGSEQKMCLVYGSER